MLFSIRNSNYFFSISRRDEKLRNHGVSICFDKVSVVVCEFLRVSIMANCCFYLLVTDLFPGQRDMSILCR